MKRSEKGMLAINGLLIAAIFILNYFYQSNGFDFTLKCICSGGFVLLGIINLAYALLTRQPNSKFFIGMAAGLVLAMLGDVTIGYDFIIGAAVFALGHICFVVAYVFLEKMRLPDVVLSGGIFLAAAAFLLFCPLLHFDVPLFQVVCIVYALIISLMLGKAVSNFLRERNAVTGTIAIASALFFFSDLMLVLDWFIGLWDWTSEACMGTYYPALCLLALAMYIQTAKQPQKIQKAKRNTVG